MEDYWNVPRELIYRERENLNDFGVKDSHSLNGRLFQLLSEQFLSANGADTLLLQCFNNAYYLCTIILLEDLPHLKVDKYENNLLMMNVQWNRDACAASFALAYEMLQVCEPKYQKDSLLLKAIYHRFRYNEWNGIVAAKTFYELIDKVEKDDIFLSKNEFAPRDIVEIIEDVGDSKPYLLEQNVEYICERLACIDDPQRRIFVADLAIAHLKGFLQETYEDYGYDPKTKSFEPAVPGTFGAEPDFEVSFWKEVNPIKEAIEYISEHYPTKDKHDSMEKKAEPSHIPEIENLQAKILELESKLTCQEGQLVEANKNNAQQAIRIKELEAEVIPIKDLEADLEELRKWKHLSRERVALFCHALAEYCEFVQKTKQDDIAPMAHELFGIGKKSAYNLMVSGYSKEDREHVAQIFEAIWPPFADFILNTFDKKEQPLKQ